MNKKKLTLFLTAAVLTTTTAFSTVVPVTAAPTKTSKKWAKAYMKIIKKANAEDKKNSYSKYTYNMERTKYQRRNLKVTRLKEIIKYSRVNFLIVR